MATIETGKDKFALAQLYVTLSISRLSLHWIYVQQSSFITTKVVFIHKVISLWMNLLVVLNWDQWRSSEFIGLVNENEFISCNELGPMRRSSEFIGLVNENEFISCNELGPVRRNSEFICLVNENEFINCNELRPVKK